MPALDGSRIRVPGAEVRVVERCGSTNAVLLEERPAHAVLLAADLQTAGRGQRGRRWHSAGGAGATFTLMRRLECEPRSLAGLSLAVGVAAARALKGLGAEGVSLKWPNDLLVEDAKLGGILVQTRLQGTAAWIAAGIGINCRPVAALGARLRRKVVALDDLVRPALARETVIAALGREVLDALGTWERRGLAAFAPEWRALHAHEGRTLRVRFPDGRTLSGVAEGVAQSGALRLRTRSGVREVADGRIVGAGRAA